MTSRAGVADDLCPTNPAPRAAEMLSRVRAATTRLDSQGHGPTISRAWAATKVIGLLPTMPLLATFGSALALLNHRRAQAVAIDTPRRIASLFDPLPRPVEEVVHLDALTNIVITSDIHRGATPTTSWAERSGADDVYRAAIAEYGDDGWTLIENGDADDMWLVGGNTWGVAHDAVRMIGGAALAVGHHALSATVAAEHLTAITEHHRDTFATIRSMFDGGRYIRTVGNHDDVLRYRAVQEALRRAVPDATVSRSVVLHGSTIDQSAIVEHGHHSDGWNAPGRASLGRVTTWLASALADLPGGARRFGPPGSEATRRVLDGEWPNRVLRVHPHLGANLDHDSMDEEDLAAAFERWFGDEPRPWLLFGHTHSPVLEPFRTDGTRFRNYANSGAAMWTDMATAIEWHGSPPTGEPRVELVAWTRASPAGPVTRTLLHSAPIAGRRSSS